MPSNQLKLNVSAKFDNGVMSPVELAVVNRYKSVTTQRPNFIRQQIAITPTAVLLGAADGLGGTMLIVNFDQTNFVTIYRASGAHALAILRPDINQDGTGGFLFVDAVGADWLAPYAVADTAACEIGTFTCPP